MSIEAVAATTVAPPPRITDLAPAMPQAPGFGAQANFEAALQQMSGSSSISGTQDVPSAVKGLLDTLDKVDGEAKGVADYAKSAEASGSQLTPGEIVQLTMRCQEFSFHCQLSSSIANRSSDGIQQLFRQQS